MVQQPRNDTLVGVLLAVVFLLTAGIVAVASIGKGTPAQPETCPPCNCHCRVDDYRPQFPAMPPRFPKGVIEPAGDLE